MKNISYMDVQLPAGVSLQKRSRLLFSTCLDVLLGTSLWYILVQLSVFIGLPYQGSVSGYVACAVVAILLPASWYARWRVRQKREGAMVD